MNEIKEIREFHARILATMAHIVDVFERLEKNYYLSSGTLLGMQNRFLVLFFAEHLKLNIWRTSSDWVFSVVALRLV